MPKHWFSFQKHLTNALKNDTKALNDIINSKGTNDAIMKAFNKLNATNKALNAPSSKPAKK